MVDDLFVGLAISAAVGLVVGLCAGVAIGYSAGQQDAAEDRPPARRPGGSAFSLSGRWTAPTPPAAVEPTGETSRRTPPDGGSAEPPATFTTCATLRDHGRHLTLVPPPPLGPGRPVFDWSVDDEFLTGS